jgi:hypothetical protein
VTKPNGKSALVLVWNLFVLYFKMAFEFAEMNWKDGQESAAQKVVAEQEV